MDSHFLRSVSPRYPSPSSPQATTQRPSRSSSPTHPWPRWCWVTPGSHSTILGWIGVGTPCRSGVEPAMPLVLCLLAFLCVILCCRRRWGTCLTCPRSISNSPAVFQALVNDVLRDMVDQFIYVYLDDILIFSSSLQEHVQHVRRVLQRLLENGLFVKAEKCAFHAQSVPFLGFIVSPEGVRMDPDRVKAVVNWPTPDSRKALLRFLGFANFYRRFIRNFSQLAAPLTALTSTKMTFRWSNAAEAAFTKLRGRFVSAPILRAPDPTRQFVVEVDASEVGVGAVLSQRATSDDKVHPCAFFFPSTVSCRTQLRHR